MTNQSTIDKLIEMHMTPMADSFRIQMQDASMKDVPFEDRFGMEACKHYYSVKYVRVPDLLLDLQEARDNGHFREVLKKYTNPVLLILDEWLLMTVTEKDSANLLELIHKRRKHSSTIFCSQYLEEDWYEKLGGKDNPLTDAIMDRISFDSYKIPIKSLNPERDVSMREVYGLDPSQAQ